MANKKPTIKRKRRKPLSSGVTTRRRKSVPRSKGLLADMFNPTIAMHSAKSTLSAASGGLGAVITNKLIFSPTTSKGIKLLTALGVGFFASSFGMPSIGSGFTGGLIALNFQNGLMADDDTNFADENSLSDQPIFLDENGEPMVLEENENGANFRYLDDDEMQQYQNAPTY